MHLPLEAWLVIVLLASCAVMVCLKTVAADLDHAIRWQRLRIEAHRLRTEQFERLKQLRLKMRTTE